MIFSRSFFAVPALIFFAFILSLAFSPAIFGNEGKNTVTGQVSDDHGFPLEHVFVFPEPIGKTGGPIPEIAVYTNRNGCFVWHVPPGRYQFRFQKAGYQTTYSVVKADANKVVRIRIKMKKEKKTAQPS